MNPDDAVRTAWAYLDQNRPDRALQHARTAVARAPDDVEAHQALAVALARTRQFPEAVRSARRGLTLAPTDLVLLHVASESARCAGDRRGALDFAVAGLGHYPDHAPLHTSKALALSRFRRRRDEALAAARRAVELDPTSADAHRALGDVHSAAKQWDAAVRAYRRALEIDPEHAIAHTNLGATLANSSQAEAAVEHTVAAARLDPTNEVARGNLRRFSTAQISVGFFGLWFGGRALAILLGSGHPVAIGVGVLAVVAIGVFWYRRRARFRAAMPDDVLQALRAERRRRGWLPTWSLVVGCMLAGPWTLVLLLMYAAGEPMGDRAGLRLAAGVTVLGLLVWRLRVRWARIDPRNAPWSAWAWVVLTGLLLLLALSNAFDGDRSGSTFGARFGPPLVGLCWAAVPAFVAWTKLRPARMRSLGR